MKKLLVLSVLAALSVINLYAGVPRGCPADARIELNASHGLRSLKSKAQTSLRANIVTVDTGLSYIRAGANHFGSLWTRDFVYSAPGAMELGEDGIFAVRSHISRLLYQLDHNNLVPRLFDSAAKGHLKGSERRIAAYLLDGRSPISIGFVRFLEPFNFLNGISVEFNVSNDPTAYSRREEALRLRDTAEQPLLPEYIGEHGTPALDSNALTVIGAIQYYQKTNDVRWLQFHTEQMKKALEFYAPYFSRRGLIRQPRYSDWQDSVQRSGHSFYVNFLYWKVQTMIKNLKESGDRNFASFNIDVAKLNRMRSLLWEDFFDPSVKLFQTHPNLVLRDRYGLEDQLFALQTPEFFEGVAVEFSSNTFLSGEQLRNSMYQSLKRSELWKGSQHTHYDFNVPGLATSGPYFFWDRSIQTVGSGLRRYHDKFIWSWLVAESAKVATMFEGREAGMKILMDFYNSALFKNDAIGEIYTIGCHSIDESVTGLLGIPTTENRYFYRSEAPFSWGAGKILEAISYME